MRYHNSNFFIATTPYMLHMCINPNLYGYTSSMFYSNVFCTSVFVGSLLCYGHYSDKRAARKATAVANTFTKHPPFSFFTLVCGHLWKNSNLSLSNSVVAVHPENSKTTKIVKTAGRKPKQRNIKK